MKTLCRRGKQINIERSRIPENNNSSIASYISISKILSVLELKFMHTSNLGREQFGFKKTVNIHLRFLHEANNLMLFQGIIKTPDILVVDNHEFAGEGGTLPPLLFCL
jgi:hypothetical protein